jgi:hypothetical protein
MAELESAAVDVHIQCPMKERVIYTAIVIASPVEVTLWAVMSGVPLLSGLIAAAIVEVFLLPLMITAYRFEVRVDGHEILHREVFTRRIPLERVEQIRVAHETRRGMGWPVEHTKIEVLGNGTRILVSWRSGRMTPLLRFLEQQFPHRVEGTESLPDA